MEKRTMRLEILTPDSIFYTGEAVMAELNTTEGEIGVYPNHIPMTMVAAPGTLTITELNGTKKAELNSGFLEIQKNKMTIMAEEIKWLEK